MLASRFAQSCVHSKPQPAPTTASERKATLALPLPRHSYTISIKPAPIVRPPRPVSRLSIAAPWAPSHEPVVGQVLVEHAEPEFAAPTEEPDDNSLWARSERAPLVESILLRPHFLPAKEGDKQGNGKERGLWVVLYILWSQPGWAEQELLVLSDMAIEDLGLGDDQRRALVDSGLVVEQPADSKGGGTTGSLIALRSAFWAGAGQTAKWTKSHTPWVFPEATNDDHNLAPTQNSPERWTGPKPSYSTHGPLYRRYIPHLGQTLSFRLIDPANEDDVKRFAKWQDSDRVHAGWRQRASSIDEHRAYVDKVHKSPDSWGLVGYWDDEPWGYVEIYWARESNIAPFFDVRPFDRGFHALVGEDKFRGEHRVRAWMSSVLHLIFLLDPRTDRVVSEPRASNAKMVQYECLNGGHVEKLIDLSHKRAALVFFPRERFFQLCPMAWSPQTTSTSSS